MTSTVRAIVATGLVVIGVACVAGAFVLAWTGHSIPSTLDVATGVALGALARVMPSDRSEPPPPEPPPDAPTALR